MIPAQLFDLTGKRVLVAGGDSGIGRAISDVLLAANATVVIAGLDIGDEGIAIDFTEPGAAEVLVEEAKLRLEGPIDILVSNAGIEGPVESMADAGEDALKKLIDVNLLSAYLLAARCAPDMASRGGG